MTAQALDEFVAEADAQLTEYPPTDETFNPLPPSGTCDGAQALSGRLAAAMLEITSVQKRGRNEFHKYDYATAEDVKRTARDALAKHGIAIFPAMRDIKIEKAGKSSHTTIMFDMIVACESGSISVPWIAEALDTQDKGISKCVTAGMKYFLINLLQIPTGSEDDSDNGVPSAPDYNGGLTIEKARSMTTPKGTPFGDLTADQLQTIMDNTKSNSPAYKAAAMVIDELIKPEKE